MRGTIVRGTETILQDIDIHLTERTDLRRKLTERFGWFYCPNETVQIVPSNYRLILEDGRQGEILVDWIQGLRIAFTAEGAFTYEQ